MSKRLEIVAGYSKSRISLDEINIDSYVSTDNLLQNKQGKITAEKMPKQTSNSVTRFDKGDILVANIRPYLKKIWLAKYTGGSSSDVLTLKVKDNFNSTFVYYSLFRDDFFEHMMNGSKGTKMPRGDKNQILDFPVPDFNIDTQKQIAKVLSDLDAKIEVNNKINAELEAMAKTIYDYWFVQFDFPTFADYAASVGTPEMTGKPYKSSGGKMVFNEELKRDIPEGWEAEYLNDVLEELTKGTTTSYVEKSDLINLNQKVNRGFKLDRQYFKYLDENIDVPSGKYASEKDILINSLGQGTLGRIHYYCEKADNVVVDQHLFILRVNELKITSTYLYQLLNSKPYQLQIERQITGSTGMQMLNATNLKNLKFVVPKMDLLNQFENLVYPKFKKVVINEKENQKLAELRDWLLPMLMNGQATVRSPEASRDDRNLGMVAEDSEEYKNN
jgi:type I restriction enzyme S subunit